ncbi:MAG: RodZ domain-containing protein [Aestuariivirga sp.]|uniref:helix-turn-helix domain-containing protein n=1 Tax=Aestuariivirga sp. TaxID=2650926 RepID=UPI0038CFFA29
MRNDSVEMTEEAASAANIRDEAPYQTEQETDSSHIGLRGKPDGAADPLGEAGWYLEYERLSRGLSLAEAGEGSGIHPYHLEAIENGDLTRLPERREALELISAYADYLGFDPEPLVQHYAHFLPLPPLAAEPRHPANPAPLTSARVLPFGRFAKLPKLRRIPGGAGGLVASTAAAVLLFAAVGYFLLPGGDKPAALSEQPSAESADISAAPQADPMPTASTAPDAAAIMAGEPPAASATAPGEDDLVGTGLDGITALIEKSMPDGEPVPAVTDDVSAGPEGRTFGAANGESRLMLKAKAPVWVRIEDNQGRVVMTQMLMKGDIYRVPNRDGLIIIARDGGLLSYSIDGRDKGMLGTPGEILVGRSLDLKALEG